MYKYSLAAFNRFIKGAATTFLFPFPYLFQSFPIPCQLHTHFVYSIHITHFAYFRKESSQKLVKLVGGEFAVGGNDNDGFNLDGACEFSASPLNLDDASNITHSQKHTNKHTSQTNTTVFFPKTQTQPALYPLQSFCSYCTLTPAIQAVLNTSFIPICLI